MSHIKNISELASKSFNKAPFLTSSLAFGVSTGAISSVIGHHLYNNTLNECILMTASFIGLSCAFGMTMKAIDVITSMYDKKNKDYAFSIKSIKPTA